MVQLHFKTLYVMIINNKILLSFFLLLSALHGHQSVQESDRWINVTGTGIVSASPDLAILRMGVLSTAKTAKSATEINESTILLGIARRTSSSAACVGPRVCLLISCQVAHGVHGSEP